MNHVSIEQRPSWANWDRTMDVDQVRSCKDCEHCFRLPPEPEVQAVLYLCRLSEVPMSSEQLKVGVGRCQQFKVRRSGAVVPMLDEASLSPEGA